MTRFAVMLMLVGAFWTGFGNNEKKLQIQTSVFDDQTVSINTQELSEQFLEGIWEDEHGFFCEYRDSVFYYGTEARLENCKITKDIIQGTKDSNGDERRIRIQVLSQDSIQIDGKTAYRSSSETAKAYSNKIKDKIMGDWVFINDSQDETIFKIADTQFILTDVFETEVLPIDSSFENSQILLKYGDEKIPLSVRVDEECLTMLLDGGYPIKLYRLDSKAYKEYLKEQEKILIGKWLFVNSETQNMQKWEITKDKVTYTSFKKDAKSKTVPYVLKRKKDGIHLRVNGTSYLVEQSYDTIYLKSEKGYYYLIASDSQEGKQLLERMEIQNKDGSIEKRTFTYPWQDDILKKITITLICKNNILLEDMIHISNAGRELQDSCYLKGMNLKIDPQYSKAYVTVKYDPSKLLYDCEDDLAILYCKGGDKTLLTTKKNQKYHTLTVAYYGEGDYFIVDRYLYEGNRRDPFALNPKNTSWALENNTGDILKLIDLDYIKRSKGDFTVSTPEQLASAVYYVNTISGYVVIELTKDIDLTKYQWAAMGWSNGWTQYPFEGTIIGNNHKIKGLHIKNDYGDCALIGWETGCLVQDLVIEDAVISGGSSTAILSGEAIGGRYVNCQVNGTVEGYGSTGSMLGHAAHCDIENCKADVIVNGEAFPFLTYNEKRISEIKVEKLVTITLSDDHTITRPKETGYPSVNWVIYYNGKEVLGRVADNEYSYKYFGTMPGEYECYLEAWVEGQYVPISNKVKYTIKE